MECDGHSCDCDSCSGKPHKYWLPKPITAKGKKVSKPKWSDIERRETSGKEATMSDPKAAHPPVLPVDGLIWQPETDRDWYTNLCRLVVAVDARREDGLCLRTILGVDTGNKTTPTARGKQSRNGGGKGQH